MSIPPGQPPEPPGGQTGGQNWQPEPPPPPPPQPPGVPGYGGGQPGSPEIPNYLVWSILTTIFCCLPFGIVSIVHAARVDGRRASGDIQGAMEASRKAKTWAIVAASAGVVVALLYLIFFLFIGASVFSGISELESFPDSEQFSDFEAPAFP